MFVTLEGIEGCGKSTQARRLAAALGPDTVLTHEPGGTPLGRSIRQLLLDPAGAAVGPRAEVLLYFADRAQNVAEIVRPALAAGRSVVCDRYVDSSLAYQGYGRGLPLAELRSVAQVATGGLSPDLTLLIDVSVETGLGRVRRRGVHDRLEGELVEFHERVRAGYHELARAEPGRWVVVDGEPDEETIFRGLVEAVTARGVRTHGVR